MATVLLNEALLSDYLNNLGKDIVEQMMALYVQQADIYTADIAHAITEQSQPLWQEHCIKSGSARHGRKSYSLV